jgi:hypothetical protein
MTMRMLVVVAAMTLVAGLAATTLSGSPALVFAVVLVALIAWGLPAFLQWRGALRVRLTGESVARRARRRPSEARPD